METRKTVEREEIIGAEDKLFNFRPLFFFAVFFMFGILFTVLRQSKNLSPWWLCLFVLLFLPFVFCRSVVRAKRIFIGILSLFCAFALGIGAFLVQAENFQSGGVYNGACAVQGRVVKRTETNDSLCVTLDNLVIEGNEKKGKLVAYLPSTYANAVTVCDEVLLLGALSTDTRVFVDGEVQAYAVQDNRRYQMTADDCVVIGRKVNVFLLLRERIERAVYTGMDETPAAVTMAILTGDTDGIGNGLLQNIRYGGIAHIFAVSGLHIGALYAFCLWVINKTKGYRIPKAVRFVLVAAVLLFYGGVCGYSASVIRAVVMCLVLYASKLIGFGTDLSERLGLAAIIVLLLSPVSLFTIGFQLSFAACLGIAWLAPSIQKGCYAVGELFVREKDEEKEEDKKDGKPPTITQRVVKSVLSFFSVTVSAQLATAPLSYYAFGYLSGWALLLNCLFVPVLSAAFSALLLFVVLACVLPLSASGIILCVPNAVWLLLLLVFEWFDFTSFALTGITLGGGVVAAYYIALLFFTDKWNISKTTQRIIAISFTVLTLTALLLTNF